MKKWSFYILIFLLSSCKNHEIQSIEYEIKENRYVYAYQRNSKDEMEVPIEYEIYTSIDIFRLYTIYQNYLPIGYVSYGTSNVGLLQTNIENNIVTYTVDSYICLCEDIQLFHNLLKLENQKLGYEDVRLLYK